MHKIGKVCMIMSKIDFRGIFHILCWGAATVWIFFRNAALRRRSVPSFLYQWILIDNRASVCYYSPAVADMVELEWRKAVGLTSVASYAGMMELADNVTSVKVFREV